MGQFNKLIITDQGRDLQAKAQIGVVLEFTRVAVGDGQLPQGTTLEELTSLVNEKQSLPITSIQVSGGTSRIRTVISNEGLELGFYIREIGLFATDPDIGEILYCVANAGALADYLPASGGYEIVDSTLDLVTIVGNAENVTAVIDESLTFATIADLNDHKGTILKHRNIHISEAYPTAEDGEDGDIWLVIASSAQAVVNTVDALGTTEAISLSADVTSESQIVEAQYEIYPDGESSNVIAAGTLTQQADLDALLTSTYNVDGPFDPNTYRARARVKNVAGYSAWKVSAAFVVEAVNLLINGGFETYTGVDGVADDWSLLATANGSASIDTVVFHSGLQSQKFTVTPSETDTDTYARTNQLFPVTEGEKYLVQWFTAGQQTQLGRDRVILFWIDAGGAAIEEVRLHDGYALEATFKAGERIVKVPTGAVQGRLHIQGYCYFIGSSMEGNFDDVSVSSTTGDANPVLPIGQLSVTNITADGATITYSGDTDPYNLDDGADTFTFDLKVDLAEDTSLVATGLTLAQLKAGHTLTGMGWASGSKHFIFTRVKSTNNGKYSAWVERAISIP